MFIILSGASLALSPIGTGWKEYLRFEIKRLSSILPFYWVAYFSVGIFLFLFFGRFAMHDDIPKILLTLFGIDGYMGTQTKTYYLIGEWFTGFILIMYLFAPFVYMSLKKTKGLILPLYFVICILSLHYSPALSKTLFFWNKFPHYNVLSRIMEFALGMTFSLFFLKRKRLHALLSIVGIVYISIYCLAGKNMLDFSALAFLSLFFLFVIATFGLNLIPFADSQCKCIAFLSKYSFMAFLFHHQVLWVMKDKMTMKCSPMYTTYQVLAACFVSYILAYFFYRPASALKAAVFGPFSSKKTIQSNVKVK